MFFVSKVLSKISPVTKYGASFRYSIQSQNQVWFGEAQNFRSLSTKSDKKTGKPYQSPFNGTIKPSAKLGGSLSPAKQWWTKKTPPQTKAKVDTKRSPQKPIVKVDPKKPSKKPTPPKAVSAPIKTRFAEYTYEGEKDVSGKPHGKGTIVFKSNGAAYTGEFVDGKMHGTGTLSAQTTLSEDPIIFTGEFHNGRPFNGSGAVVTLQGYTSGTWVGGKLCGKSKKVTVNGNVLEREFVDGIQQGLSTLTTASGSVLQCEFKDGKIWSGVGRAVTDNGNLYEGEWREGTKTGRGTMQYRTRKLVYVGEFVNSLPSGEGTETHTETGTSYTGKWAEGVRHGPGVEVLQPSGNRYEGEWFQGLKEGTMVVTSKDGRKFTGVFHQDRIVSGSGYIEYSPATSSPSSSSSDADADAKVSKSFDGSWKLGKREGHGRQEDGDGCYFVGFWQQGRRVGEGRGRSRDRVTGAVYEGEFEDGLPHGKGKISYSDGSIYEGEWHKNQLHGRGRRTSSPESGSVVTEELWEDGIQMPSPAPDAAA
jgi:hypothetical protein